jgi:4-amino-4-deoxy-L-arabinose transferase-like glycosyltransferase
VSASSRQILRPRLAFGVVVAVYLALLLPTLGRHGIGWDEQTDLGVARAYLESPGGWLVGSDVDPINVRLPMAATAALFALTGGPSLITARLLPSALGVLTLAAVFIFCRRELDDRKALAACLVLATSPYYLAYAKAAFSEGDAFVTCALACLLACLSFLWHERSLGWGAVTGVALGAALASKISAVAAIPVVLLAALLPPADAQDAGETVPRRAWTAIAALLAVLWVSVFGGWELGKAVAGGGYGGAGLGFLAAHALVVGALWLAVLAVAAKHRGARLGRGKLAAFALLLGSLTFFALPPLHTTNPDVFLNLVGAFLFSNFASPASFALEAAALHATVVTLKPSLVVGIGIWASVVAAAFRARARPELRLPLLFVACYALFLLRLPWAQPFYLMPAFPALAILLADAGVELFDRRRRTALALCAAAIAFLGADLMRSYPDLHLNGYQWVGARIWGGRPTLGARSVVPIPADGADEVLRWVDERAQAGDSVVTFVRPFHILAATLGHPPYRVVDGLSDPAAIAGADYVVTTLGAELRHGYGGDDPSEVFAVPYDASLLLRDFRKVHAVDRTFGLEIAAVWRRNPVPRR